MAAASTETEIATDRLKRSLAGGPPRLVCRLLRSEGHWAGESQGSWRLRIGLVPLSAFWRPNPATESTWWPKYQFNQYQD
jgi:hypothetical protein